MCSNILKNFGRLAEFLKPNLTCNITVARGRKSWLRPYLISLYKRRIDQGPEPERPRSAWINWNYDAEIFSFGKRLGEEFQSDTLKIALTNRSYIELEKEKRGKLGLENDLAQVQLKDNEELQEKGEAFAREYVKAYLEHCYPLLPEDGISALLFYLFRDETLSHVAFNLGLRDLILTEEFPVSNETLSRTFKAVIGALCHDQGRDRAGLFVQDFLLTQLVGKSVRDIWDIKNPMGMLTEILEKQKRGLPEPRLLWASGSETILATYMVGIYSDKELIGQSAGETVTIAEEMAARDALGRIFQITNSATPLPFGKKGLALRLKQNDDEASLSSVGSSEQRNQASQ